MNILYEAKLISERTLSFALRSVNRESVMLFGEPDLSLANGFSLNATMDIIDRGILYFVPLFRSYFGGLEVSASGVVPALLDTGTSLIVMPKAAFSKLV